MTFEQLQQANETIRKTDIKGKMYAEVNERIKAFRMLYPEGTIKTEMLSNENGVCIFKAEVYAQSTLDETNDTLLGVGHAYEKEDSSFINKTSYIENCETSAVGRALAMCGIGIDTSIASADEVANAIRNQGNKDEALKGAKARTEVLKVLNGKSDKYINNVLEHYGVEKPSDLTIEQCEDFLANQKG